MSVWQTFVVILIVCISVAVWASRATVARTETEIWRMGAVDNNLNVYFFSSCLEEEAESNYRV